MNISRATRRETQQAKDTLKSLSGSAKAPSNRALFALLLFIPSTSRCIHLNTLHSPYLNSPRNAFRRLTRQLLAKVKVNFALPIGLPWQPIIASLFTRGPRPIYVCSIYLYVHGYAAEIGN